MPSCGLVCYQSSHDASFICSPVQNPVAWMQDAFQYFWDNLNVYAFPPFTLLSHVMLRVMLSVNLYCLTSGGVFTDLLALMVEELVELPMLWNHLVQLHVRKLLGGLEMLRLHMWKLSSHSFARLAFPRRLQRSSLQILEEPQLVSTRESGVDFFIVFLSPYVSILTSGSLLSSGQWRLFFVPS